MTDNNTFDCPSCGNVVEAEPQYKHLLCPDCEDVMVMRT